MISRLVSYFDRKLGVYGAPMSIPECSNESLIEQTRRMCADPKMPSSMFDYDIYDLGTFDDKTGEFVLSVKPDFIVSLGDYRYFRGDENVKG